MMATKCRSRSGHPGTIDKIYPQSPGAYGFEIGEPAVKNVLSRVTPNFPYLIKTVCKKDSQEITDMDRENIHSTISDSEQSLILITHGTDTMCETARFLETKIKDSNDGKVVIITGAFKPECMRDTDADFNLGIAVGFLQASPASGVYVAMNGQVISSSHVIRNSNGKFVVKQEVK